jgi:methylmalonyl-CoA epimerase
MVAALDHIAIAVPDLGKAVNRFIEDFGLKLERIEEVESAQTTTAFYPMPTTNIELVSPPLRGGGPIAKYLERRPGGIHHICFRTDNIAEDVERLKAKGYQFLSDAPYSGAHGCMVIFIHPKSCDGVLIELSQLSAAH